jgi:hypothetical protein
MINRLSNFDFEINLRRYIEEEMRAADAAVEDPEGGGPNGTAAVAARRRVQDELGRAVQVDPIKPTLNCLELRA